MKVICAARDQPSVARIQAGVATKGRPVSLIKFGRPSDNRTRRGSLKIPRVRSSCWFDKKKVRLFVRNRAVFDSSWHDKKLARTKNDVSFPHLNRDLTFQDEKETSFLVRASFLSCHEESNT